MVMTDTREAQRVLNPKIIKIGAMNSPNTAKKSDGTAPTPNGSANSKSPLINFKNFP